MALSQICSALNLIMHIFIHCCHYLNLSYFEHFCQEFLCCLYFGYRTRKHTRTFMCSFSNAQHIFNFHLSMFNVAVNYCGDFVILTVRRLFRLYLIGLLFMPLLHSQKVVKLRGYETIA